MQQAQSGSRHKSSFEGEELFLSASSTHRNLPLHQLERFCNLSQCLPCSRPRKTTFRTLILAPKLATFMTSPEDYLTTAGAVELCGLGTYRYGSVTACTDRCLNHTRSLSSTHNSSSFTNLHLYNERLLISAMLKTQKEEKASQTLLSLVYMTLKPTFMFGSW